ncbi:hypothetical protein EPH_0008720 [Eimeria praecox]|uniref:Uncharacterized protein n=1 Tax=Eimeria praecox TaxID=51316 RepID=U6GIR3_9EIME|nr:hypothetical protein EPH_0008720 [Eimeria praecox]
MLDGRYAGESAANPAVGSTAIRGPYLSASLRIGRHSSPNTERSTWNFTRLGTSTRRSKSASSKEKRAFFAAALAGFLAGFCAVSAGWIDLKDLPGGKDTGKLAYPPFFLADGTPNPNLYHHAQYQQEYPQQSQQQPYSLQPPQQPFPQQPPQQPFPQQPPQQPELQQQPPPPEPQQLPPPPEPPQLSPSPEPHRSRNNSRRRRSHSSSPNRTSCKISTRSQGRQSRSWNSSSLSRRRSRNS